MRWRLVIPLKFAWRHHELSRPAFFLSDLMVKYELFSLLMYEMLTAIDLPILIKALYVPRDAFSVMPLAKTIAICTERGIVIANPSRYVVRSLLCDSLPIMSLQYLYLYYFHRPGLWQLFPKFCHCRPQRSM